MTHLPRKMHIITKQYVIFTKISDKFLKIFDF